jgi:hypothetical protein
MNGGVRRGSGFVQETANPDCIIQRLQFLDSVRPLALSSRSWRVQLPAGRVFRRSAVRGSAVRSRSVESLVRNTGNINQVPSNSNPVLIKIST